MIRPAVEADIPRLIDMIERLAGIVNDLTVDRIRAGETLSSLIHDPAGIVFCTDGGFIAGRVADTFIGRDLVAYEMGWFSSNRSGLKLLQVFEKWARDQGATTIAMSCNGGVAQRVLEKCGYRAAESKMVQTV